MRIFEKPCDNDSRGAGLGARGASWSGVLLAAESILRAKRHSQSLRPEESLRFAAGFIGGWKHAAS